MTDPTALDRAVIPANRPHADTERLTITVCGSLSRAAADMARITWHLKAAGHDVYAPTPAPPDITTVTAEQVRNITAGHYAAIDRSHLVIGVVPDAQIGSATGGETGRAVSRSIPVLILMSPAEVDALIADITAGRLPARIEAAR